MFSSVKHKAKKLGLMLALGSATAWLGAGCSEKDTRTASQKANDEMVEVAKKSGTYMASFEPDDNNKGYYSDIINGIFTNSDFIIDEVLKDKKHIDSGLAKALEKLGVDKNQAALFLKNYGAGKEKNNVDWLIRFREQANTAKSLLNKTKKGFVPLTQDGVFWRFEHNSVNLGDFRPTLSDTKSYGQKNRINYKKALLLKKSKEK